VIAALASSVCRRLTAVSCGFADRLVHLRRVEHSPLGRGVRRLVGTFVFYWWHRIRHADGSLAGVPPGASLAQPHRSLDLVLTSTPLRSHRTRSSAPRCSTGSSACRCGCAYWFNFFAATAGILLSRELPLAALAQVLRSDTGASLDPPPRWMFTTTTSPTLPLWDRLSARYKDTTSFAPACGFPRQNEQVLGRGCSFSDVYAAA